MELIPHHGAWPEVHPGAWVASTVVLIGDVSIAEGASIWFGSVLRGDVCSISIGRFSNIQDNTVIHAEGPHGGEEGKATIVGEQVTVGHSVIVHGCRIDDRVLVGMGSVVMNGAHIHSDTVLGARALVSEGKEIPGRSLALGIPAKVLRALSPEEVASIIVSAQHYQDLAKTYPR